MSDGCAHTVGYLGSRGEVVPRDGEFLPVENPATGELIGRAFEVTADVLDEVVEGAAATFAGVWRRTTPDRRGEMLGAWADLIEARRTELADLEVSDVGHLRREALGDLDAGVRIIRYYAGMAD